MKTLFKALVTDTQDGTKFFIEFEAKNKKTFIEEMQLNGYKVFYNKVEEKAVYDWIMENTNADAQNWKNYKLMAEKAVK